MTEQEALDALAALKTELRNVRQIKRCSRINLFTAAGLGMQEVKHSAFLSWLLNSEETHDLGNYFVKKLCEHVYDYQTRAKVSTTPESNAKILSRSNVSSKSDLVALVQGITLVDTEKVIVNAESRTDIIIDIPATQTVIVIENKINAQVGRDQLIKYEIELNDPSSSYCMYPHKIYIFLTKFGDLPINLGGNEQYNNHWCVFDYEGIVTVVKELLADMRAKKLQVGEQTKLKTLLEDYSEMVDFDILEKSAVLRKECKKVMEDKQLRDAFALLNKYIESYASYGNVLDHCKNWLKSNVPNIVIYNESKKSFCCCTEAMQNYFFSHGETGYQSGWRCLCGTSSNDDLIGFFQLYKTSSQSWSTLQDKFITANSINAGLTQATAETSVNLSLTSDRDLLFSDVQASIDKQLNIFVQRMLSFERKLLQLKP